MEIGVVISGVAAVDGVVPLIVLNALAPSVRAREAPIKVAKRSRTHGL